MTQKQLYDTHNSFRIRKQEIKTSQNTYIEPQEAKAKKKNLSYNSAPQRISLQYTRFPNRYTRLSSSKKKQKKKLVKAFDDTDRLKTKYIEIDGNFD